jgi:hypothetical protein
LKVGFERFHQLSRSLLSSHLFFFFFAFNDHTMRAISPHCRNLLLVNDSHSKDIRSIPWLIFSFSNRCESDVDVDNSEREYGKSGQFS